MGDCFSIASFVIQLAVVTPPSPLLVTNQQLELVQSPATGQATLTMEGGKGLITYQPISYLFTGDDILVYRVSVELLPKTGMIGLPWLLCFCGTTELRHVFSLACSLFAFFSIHIVNP